MQPNHHQFIAYAHVVREGSFSAAAARLGVTQSTVTQHIAKLEQQIGAQLLTRGRDGVELTRTGRDLYHLADRLVTLDAAIAEKIAGFEALERGHIRIIANAPLPALRLIGQFRRAHPDVEIEFALHDWTTATRLLRERLADVGLITSPPNWPDWESIVIRKSRYVAYLPRGSALASRDSLRLRDFANETVILPERGSLTERVLREAQAAHGVRFTRTIRIATFPLMCEAVLQGAGVAIFLSDSGLIAHGLTEVPIDELSQVYETAIVAPKDRARLRLVEALIALADVA